MPSLAGLFELADRAAQGDLRLTGTEGDDSPSLAISLEHARQAAAWCEYLESHVYRIYSCVTTPQMRAARELASKIKSGKVGADGTFTAREVYLKGWTALDSSEAVKLAAQVLVDAGWLRDIDDRPGPQGGRPSIGYRLNPKLRERKYGPE